MTTTPPSGGTTPHPKVRVAHYEDWMAPQVIALLAEEWKVPLDAETRSYHSFFDHPYQRHRALRLAAVCDETVCGFLSYVYWPYEWAGETLHVLQGGNAIVSPSYRGQRILARLASYPWQVAYQPQASFAIGFPAQTSYGSTIRAGWSNPANLSWHVRILHPLSVLRVAPPHPVPAYFETAPTEIDACPPPGVFSLSRDPDFIAWRAVCSPQPFWYFHFHDRGHTIRYQLKPNRRGRVSELIIGDVARESLDPGLLAASLRALIRAARQDHSLSILSIAINDGCSDASLLTALAACGFHAIPRHIFFCVLPFCDLPEVKKAESWFLLRGDIDNW